MFEQLNKIALDHYLRGEGGELMRREAEAELYRRGQSDGQHTARMTEGEMVEALKALGYVVFKPSKALKND